MMCNHLYKQAGSPKVWAILVIYPRYSLVADEDQKKGLKKKKNFGGCNSLRDFLKGGSLKKKLKP